MSERKYITTPIYYVNARPHLGHTYTTILCDTLARYYRLAGAKVYFLTGTDEHGDKIVKAAEANGQTPEEYTDEISKQYERTWEFLHITNDDFIRTTEPRHKKVVQAILERIHAKGDIYLSEYEGLYCTGCERYLTDKELNENGECPDHLRKPDLIKEENYFFKLQKYLPRVKELLSSGECFVSPERYRNEALGAIDDLIKQGDDLSISRPKSRLQWGIELPFDKNYVTYVWFDALLNYVSALDYPEGTLFAEFWPVAHHVIAKDILKPHAIFWPAMLLSAGIPLFQKLSVHGYWLGWGDIKMSKSLGNAADPIELTNHIGEDALRYFLAREMRFGADAKFSEELLVSRVNTDLSNELGNLLQRTLSMIKKYDNGLLRPVVEGHGLEGDIDSLLKEIDAEYHVFMKNERTDQAIELVLKLTGLLNRAVEQYQPWSMAKSGDENLIPLLHAILRGALGALCYLRPFLPNAYEKMVEQVSFQARSPFPVASSEISWNETNLEKLEPLFPRIDSA